MKAFAQSWSAEILKAPPMIAPARQFVYPAPILGEEDALARGAMRVMVRPAAGGSYLATCALGFTDKAMPSGVSACPDADQLCAVAGGYAYLASTLRPAECVLLPMKPVVAVYPAVEAGLLVFAGFHTLLAWGAGGLAWETAKLTWEGLTISAVTPTHIEGTGWDMRTDREVPFEVDLATGCTRAGPSKPVAAVILSEAKNLRSSSLLLFFSLWNSRVLTQKARLQASFGFPPRLSDAPSVLGQRAGRKPRPLAQAGRERAFRPESRHSVSWDQ